MKSLPQCKEAEASVLAGILLRNSALAEVMAVLDEESFWHAGHKAVFKAMVKLGAEQMPIDPVTLEHSLQATNELGLMGGLEGLGKLSDRYASSHHVAHHAELVRRTATLRKAVIACDDLADLGREGVEDVDAFVGEAERTFAEIGAERVRTTTFEIKEVLGDVFGNITERAKRKNPITGVATGFTELDEMMGGLQPGDLIILAARPSMGKTALALNIVENACLHSQRHMSLPPEQRPLRVPTLVFTIEMSVAQLVERILCSEAQVDSSRLRAGRVMEDEFRALVQAGARLHEAKLLMDDNSTPSITEIRAIATKWRNNPKYFPKQPPLAEGEKAPPKPLGLIVVDYLQLCRGGKNKYDSREQEISEISRGLKAIAKDLEVPVLALAQLNRGVDSRADHRPQLSDLRESGAIEQDSDVIAFIYREARYVTDEAERKKVERDAEVIIGKQRNGPIGTVHLVFRGEITRFENPARERS